MALLFFSCVRLWHGATGYNRKPCKTVTASHFTRSHRNYSLNAVLVSHTRSITFNAKIPCSKCILRYFNRRYARTE
ncbi:hypothetical protein GGR51DRAFT_490717 [Nemania sp. FL0031]|nr:hypothetical protein GGR51DRAFT_490717 [Nemania sp. FL0031]